jgi:hypothetical protein
MTTWRETAWHQIGQLEQALGPGSAGDYEVIRRKSLFAAIDAHPWEPLRDAQFGQLELATRVETDLLRYALASPPMRDLLASATAPGADPLELPPAPSYFPDWRSRALFQVMQLEEVVGGADDLEAQRRTALWVAFDRYDWPQTKEQQFLNLELATRTEVELLRALLAMPEVADMIPLAGEEDEFGYSEDEEEVLQEAEAAPAAAAPAAPKVAKGLTPIEKTDSAPAKKEGGLTKVTKEEIAAAEARLKAPPPPPPPIPGLARASFGGGVSAPSSGGAPSSQPARAAPATNPDGTPIYRGPSASQLYKEGMAAWNEYAANEFKKKPLARDAARRLKEIFLMLEKNPDGKTQVKALEQIVGLKAKDVIDHELERRIR